jgi:hypothetical protein
VTATADTVRPAPAEDTLFEAPAVLRIIWADPQHMAEHLAVWSLARFGPRASAAVERIRAGNPDAGRDEVEGLAIQRQARIAATEGAFVGGPFIVLIPFAFCAALLAQAQLVYELAALAGHDPRDRMRAAELLVLLGSYGSTEEAAAALETMTHDPKERGKRLPRGTRWNMIMRMAYLLGVFGTADDRSRLRAMLGWAGVGSIFLVGLVLPLVWVPYLAYTSRRSTLRIARRAQAYYAEGDAGHAGVTVARRQAVQAGGLVAFGRTVALVVIPIVAGVVALLAGFASAGGRWASAGVVLLAVSVLASLGWLGWRWWRHRRAARVA